MYIKSFHIEEFGPLKDFTVNDIPCGMAVFLGNNEAGKSSAMEFVRAMLTGVPAKRNALTQNIRNSKGGSMKIHDAYHGDIDVIRNFSANSSLVQLYDAHGNVCKDTILTEIMGGISRDVYRMIYGFNLVELQNINNFHGSEVFNTILGASFGLGLRGPVAALENIQEQMDAIYKTRGKNTFLQKLFDAWNNNKDALDTAFEEVKQFDVLQKERAKLDEDLSVLKNKKSGIMLKNDELQSLIGIWGQWQKWSELQNIIASLPLVTVSFPENAELVLERILEQKKIKHKSLERLKLKQNELETKQVKNQPSSILLAQHTALKDLMEEKGAYRQALAEMTSLVVKNEQFSHVMEGVNSRLKEKWRIFDGQNSERDALMGDAMVHYLEKVSHNDVFLNEFAHYETKILEAEMHAQSATTALEYAQKDMQLVEEKRLKIEDDIKKILEEENHEKSLSLFSHIDTYDKVSEQISLAKDATRLLPENLQRAQTTFEDWKKQIGYLGIRDLDTYVGEENRRLSFTAEHAEVDDASFSFDGDSFDDVDVPFTIISAEKDRNYYTYASHIICTILEQHEKILPMAQALLDEEESSQVLAGKIDNIVSQQNDLNVVFQDVDSEENENIYATEKNEFEIKNRALKKLQTVNELRSHSITRLEALLLEQNMLDINLEEKTVSKLALVPGLLCLVLGLPLLLLRILSGQNTIILDAIQNFMSFASFFPSWSGSIYVPLWLPISLTAVAAVSIYLSVSKKPEVQEGKRKLNKVTENIAEIVANLTALRNGEVSIVSNVFGMGEELQASYYEQAKTNLAHAYKGDFAQSLDIALADNLSLNESVLETNSASNEESQTDNLSLNEESQADNLSLNEDILETDSVSNEENQAGESGLILENTALSVNNDSSADEVSLTLSLDEQEQKAQEGLSVTSISYEEYLNQDPHSISYILKGNGVYGELARIILQELQDILEKEYAHLIIEEQQNGVRIQTEEKRAELLGEKKLNEESFDESRELLYSYRMEWEKFFQQQCFTEIPNPKYMEAFFLRVEACENIQKRLIEFNKECFTYNNDINTLHDVSRTKFTEVYKKIRKSLYGEEINISLLIEEMEKHIQKMRLSFLRGKDTAVQEATLGAAIQAETQAKTHTENVRESMRERQKVVDKCYVDCVLFLCKNGVLSSHDASQHYEKMLGELIGGMSDIDKINECELVKKISLPLVKQVLELMGRFDDARIEHGKIKTDILATEDIIADFESFLKDLMEEAEFTPFLSDSESSDYLESFEQFYKKIEQEIDKSKDKENIGMQYSQVGQEIEDVQIDIDEIDNNMKALLDLANVQSESHLRELVETQKQREQIIRSSLALEEPFRSVELPTLVGKSMKPCTRKYKEDFAWNIAALPEIFGYFDEMAKEIWQEELSSTKKSHSVIEAHEHEIQNNYGVLQAKCDALIHSATLASFRREQLEIEEKIEEAYERWLELSFTKQVIVKARKQYEHDKQPKVIEMASEFFAIITDNAWEKIVVAIDDKNIKVVGKNGVPLSPEVLSQGAKEQLYLSLRLAHIQNRGQNQQYIPILMDDILVNFDKNRIEKTIETLNKIIVSYQETPIKSAEQKKTEKQNTNKAKSGTERIVRKKTLEKEAHGQQILFYTCHEDTAQMLQDKIAQTKIYLVENKTVRPA